MKQYHLYTAESNSSPLYFIKIEGCNFSRDIIMAKELGISYETYKQLLIQDKDSCKIDEDEIYFTNRQASENAIERVYMYLVTMKGGIT
jgi:hypothetical protein